MNVEELIEQLQKFPKGRKVAYPDTFMVEELIEITKVSESLDGTITLE